MPMDTGERISIDTGSAGSVSGIVVAPVKPLAAYVLAHGAGAGMEHAFMRATAEGLAQRGIATLRYQFPYMERGSKRPDTPAVAQAAVRAAVEGAAKVLPGVPLFAGGKSFGGRMTSQAQALTPLPRVRGLVFVGFPLHPAGKPGDERALHLADVKVPMLFLQGTRDELAELSLLEPVVANLSPRAELATFEHADHAFHVPAKTGMKDAEVMARMLDTLREWIDRQLA
jgi:predicted alpha/beta-hydrolase family hydrolase